MRRQPRMMTALYAETRLRAMLDIVLFESIAADAGQIAVNVETDGDRVRLEILSDATHTDDAAHLRNAIKAGAHTPATEMAIQVATMGANQRRLTWTAPELDRSQDENQAAREKDHGSTGSTKGMETGHATVQLEYRQNAVDAGSRAAWIVAEAARYTPARLAIFHDGVTIIDREDYLKNAVAVKETDLVEIGVMQTPGNPPPAEKRGGFVYLGKETPLYPDSIDALDDTHYHARIIGKAKQPHRQTVREIQFDHKRKMLRELGITTVLEHLKDKPVPRRVQREAARSGIEIPDPPICLGRWAPASANRAPNEHQTERDRRSLPYRKPETALIAGTDEEPPVIVKREDGTHPEAEQLMAIALETENRLRRSAGRPPIILAAENHDLQGYEAYDRHPYTQPETLSIRNIKEQEMCYQPDGSTGPAKPGPARPGWTVCLPIMEETTGSPTITGYLYLASPVRYAGRTTGKRLQSDYRRKVKNPLKPASLKLTKRRSKDPEASTSRIERFLIDSFGSTDADIPAANGTRPMMDIALELTETPQTRRLAMIAAGVRNTLETYTASAPGRDTVIRARRRVEDGRIEVDITETTSAN